MRLALLLALLPLPVAAQDGAAARAAETITESDVLRRIHLIAHDSMGGRWTPSRGLDLTAAYVAEEFRRFGLRPGGDSGSFLQRYPILQEVVAADRSSLGFSGPGVELALDFATEAALIRGRGTASGPVMLAGGMPDPARLERNALRGKVLVWFPDSTMRGPRLALAPRLLAPLGPAMTVVVVEDDSALAVFRRRQAQPMVSVGRAGEPIVVAVHARSLVARIPEAAGALAEARAAGVFAPREVPGWVGRGAVERDVRREEWAPNTVGILPGVDPGLRNEYVVFSAHMDHVGRVGEGPCQARDGDTICNGADDDASGTVGILELAEAFTRPGVRPRRSLIFLTVSGEERGLWGSDWFAGHPPVPLASIVANLNADMIGRNWTDTIVVIGKEHSDLGTTLHRVAARHPELGLAPIDDLWPEQRFYERSDHYHFARRGVPVLFFFNGTHEDYHRPSDHPDRIDAEKLARVARLMFWVGLEVANAPERPKWDPESYRRYVTQ